MFTCKFLDKFMFTSILKFTIVLTQEDAAMSRDPLPSSIVLTKT